VEEEGEKGSPEVHYVIHPSIQNLSFSSKWMRFIFQITLASFKNILLLQKLCISYQVSDILHFWQSYRKGERIRNKKWKRENRRRKVFHLSSKTPSSNAGVEWRSDGPGCTLSAPRIFNSALVFTNSVVWSPHRN
jgi:hypothetical protein